MPMSEEPCQTLQKVVAERKNVQPIVIDGYRDFIFLNQKGYPMTEDALPNITPHILRHTFCTRLANKNMNPKSLQYIMGHSNINITLNLYAHASLDGVKAEMVNLIP